MDFMEKQRGEPKPVKTIEGRRIPSGGFDGIVGGLNMSLGTEGGRLIEALENSPRIIDRDSAELKAARILNLSDGLTGPRTLDRTHIVREVVLAHDFSNEERRETFFAAERYRLLCTRVLQVCRSLRSQVFVVTSAIAGEGKTLTATNLAFGLSSVQGKRILLVDLDLRRPSMHRLLGVRPQPGDCSFLEKQEDWRSSLLAPRENLHVLLALNAADKPDELLHSESMERFLIEARNGYDIIVIDSAPLLVAVDTHVIISMADQALLVVRADSTPIECAREALTVLGAKAVGCVLNGVKRMKYEDYYRSYYGDERQ